MNEVSYPLIAGQKLKKLIKENYSSQEDFAFAFNTDVRTISRYVNQGINRFDVVQELAAFFQIDFLDFFKEED